MYDRRGVEASQTRQRRIPGELYWMTRIPESAIISRPALFQISKEDSRETHMVMFSVFGYRIARSFILYKKNNQNGIGRHL
jgi:hypothetical protein